MTKKIGIPTIRKIKNPVQKSTPIAEQKTTSEICANPYDSTKDTLVSITPARAKKILSCTYWDMRDVRKKKLADYSALIEQGYWVSGMTISIAVIGKREYLIDGQHRLLALISNEKTMSFKITRYYCSTREQVDTIYQIIDQNAVRSKLDTMMSAGSCKKLELSKQKLGKATSAVSMIYRQFGRAGNRLEGEAWQFSNNPLMEAIILSEKWGDAIRGYFESIQGAMTEMTRREGNLNRSICIAIGLLTFRADPVKAYKFWKGVGKFHLLEEDDPRFTAGRYIMATNMNREGGIQRYKHARSILSCWNAYAENRKLTRIMVVEKFTTKVFGFDYEI